MIWRLFASVYVVLVCPIVSSNVLISAAVASPVSIVSSLPVGGSPFPIFKTRETNIGQLLSRPIAAAGFDNVSASYGEPVQSPFRFPWAVHLLTRHDREGRVYRCDGSLVAPNVVLTAGHCENMAYAYVRAADDVSLSGYELHEVLFDEPHPYYLNNFFPEFDARLLRLKTKSNQQLLKLDDGRAFEALEHQPVLGVVGYDLQSVEPQPAVGASSNDATTQNGAGDQYHHPTTPTTSDLRWGLTVYLKSERCYPEYSHFNLITEPMLCAEKVPYFEHFAPGCSGHSGGPLLLHAGDGYKLQPWGDPSTDIQIGVMSMGMGCSHFGKPGVYAKVASLHGWIESTIAMIS